MKSALLFLAFCALFYFVPFWVILAIALYGSVMIGAVILVSMIFMDFFVGDE
jgi:hypothetical protein